MTRAATAARAFARANIHSHHAAPMPCDECLGRDPYCGHCNGAGFEPCAACGLHLSDHDGRGHYSLERPVIVHGVRRYEVCSVRCGRLVRLRACWAAVARRAA